MKILNMFYRFFTGWTGAIVLVLFVVLFIAQIFLIPTRSMVGTLFEGDMLLVKKFSYGIPTPRIPWFETRILPDFNGDGHLIAGEQPKRGEIIVFNPPSNGNVYFVKRNFAVGGDKVIFTSKGMYLRPYEGDEYINANFQNYETKVFFNEIYVKEPYAKESIGIHYGGDWPAFSSFESMLRRFELTRNNIATNNVLRDDLGIAMDLILLKGSIYGNQKNEVIFYKEIEKNHFFMIGDNRDNSDDSRFWGSVPYSHIIGKPWFSIFSLSLPSSKESLVDKDKRNLYKIRWDRSFRTLGTLEHIAKPFYNECRPYTDVNVSAC